MTPQEQVDFTAKSLRVIKTNKRYVDRTVTMLPELKRLSVPWRFVPWLRLKRDIERRNRRTRAVNAAVRARNELVRSANALPPSRPGARP